MRGGPRGLADLSSFQRDEPEHRDLDTCNTNLLSELISGAWKNEVVVVGIC